MSIFLVPGDPAPDFEATAVGGKYGVEGAPVSLGGLHGSTIVLYFYPKDDTPGCTAQACDMRDRWTRLLRPDTEFFGVSVDPIASHLEFIEKYSLPFPLLSDPDKKIVEAYGVWVEKSMYGKKFMGTERTTFVIRPDGRIKSVYRKVKPDEHSKLLIDDLANFEP